MCGGSPDAPTPPPRVPEAPIAPAPATAGQASADVRRRRAASGGGERSTILTGSRGVQNGGTTAQPTLLGS